MKRIITALAFALLALTGCFNSDALVPLEVPDGVATVEREKALFAQSPAHPLLQVRAGKVIDDLSGLAGCWGAYAGPEMLAGGLPPVRANAEFYRFDFSTMTMTHQILQRGGLTFPLAIVVECTYEFEVTRPDRITARLVSVEPHSNLAMGPPEGVQVVDDAEPIALQITLDGDAFKIGDSLDAFSDFSGPHRAKLVFKRLACP